jgi:hypothetical protein
MSKRARKKGKTGAMYDFSRMWLASGFNLRISDTAYNWHGLFASIAKKMTPAEFDFCFEFFKQDKYNTHLLTLLSMCTERILCHAIIHRNVHYSHDSAYSFISKTKRDSDHLGVGLELGINPFTDAVYYSNFSTRLVMQLLVDWKRFTQLPVYLRCTSLIFLWCLSKRIKFSRDLRVRLVRYYIRAQVLHMKRCSVVLFEDLGDVNVGQNDNRITELLIKEDFDAAVKAYLKKETLVSTNTPLADNSICGGFLELIRVEKEAVLMDFLSRYKPYLNVQKFLSSLFWCFEVRRDVRARIVKALLPEICNLPNFPPRHLVIAMEHDRELFLFFRDCVNLMARGFYMLVNGGGWGCHFWYRGFLEFSEKNLENPDLYDSKFRECVAIFKRKFPGCWVRFTYWYARALIINMHVQNDYNSDRSITIPKIKENLIGGKRFLPPKSSGWTRAQWLMYYTNTHAPWIRLYKLDFPKGQPM